MRYKLTMNLISNDNINFQIIVAYDCSNNDTVKWLKKFWKYYCKL